MAIKDGFIVIKWKLRFLNLKKDLRLFKREIENEAIRVIRNKSDALGPMKFKHENLVYQRS